VPFASSTGDELENYSAGFAAQRRSFSTVRGGGMIAVFRLTRRVNSVRRVIFRSLESEKSPSPAGTTARGATVWARRFFSPWTRTAKSRKGFPFPGKPFVANDPTYAEFQAAWLLFKAEWAGGTLHEDSVVVRVLQRSLQRLLERPVWTAIFS
jgi:hypothetical protein